MFVELLRIVEFIWKSIIHVWPYLLISVPIAVTVRMSGASKYIGKVFNKKPMVSILLATIVGAFSPFCSCSVIPIIASLLIGGVPLAPVMSFWLASPSMDPEMFFLSVSVLGWKLAVWRLSSAFAMSFISGLTTHYLVKRKWITEEATLKAYSYSPVKSYRHVIKTKIDNLMQKYFTGGKPLEFAGNGIHIIRNGYGLLDNPSSTGRVNQILSNNFGCCDNLYVMPVAGIKKEIESCGCKGTNNTTVTEPGEKEYVRKIGCCDDVMPAGKNNDGENCNCCNVTGNTKETKKEIDSCGCGSGTKRDTEKSFSNKLLRETVSATSMVVKFMILAYFLEALIVLYLPDQFITTILGKNNFVSIIMAALIGIPVYTSTMPALAMVGGLISKGMIPAAGLAFLISGPTTTIPAMAAVWNLANKKVFFLYVGFTLAFAIISGLLYYAVYSVL
jgi:uncharacterized protein